MVFFSELKNPARAKLKLINNGINPDAFERGYLTVRGGE